MESVMVTRGSAGASPWADEKAKKETSRIFAPKSWHCLLASSVLGAFSLLASKQCHAKPPDTTQNIYNVLSGLRDDKVSRFIDKREHSFAGSLDESP